jgi:hypothetical protein
MFRRFRVAVVVISTAVAGVLAAAPAHAAGPWFVAVGGAAGNTCLSVSAPCPTIQTVLAKSGFVSGDTINVGAGTFTGTTTVGAKGANIVGQGATTILDGNNAATVFVTTANVPVKLTNLTIRNGLNNASFGAGLRVQAGTVTTQNINLANNKGIYGAGAAVYGAATLNMTGGSISNNQAVATQALTGWGGGVYVAAKTATVAAGTLSLDGVTVNDNSADAVTFTLAGLGGAIFTGGTVTVANSTFSGNRALGSTTLNSTGFGGSIYYGANPPATPQLSITGTSFAGGSATSNAIYGGGIFAVSPFSATGLTATNLKAVVGGGGIYTNTDLTLTNSTLQGNQATSASTAVGGGIYAIRPSSTATSTVTLNNTTLKANTSALYAGGLVNGAGVKADIKNGSSIVDNTAVAGGGLFSSGETSVSGSSLTGNAASYQGGGIYLGSSVAADTPKLTLTNATVTNNSAASGGGGLLIFKNATANVDGGQFKGNTGLGGGAVVVGDGGTLSADGTTFEDNTASNLGGGAILNSGATTFARSTLKGNHSVHTTGITGTGAGIYSGSNTANATTSLKVRSSALIENDAWAAAAIFQYSNAAGVTNTASVDNSTVSGNTTTSTSGAIQQHHPITITNSTIVNNTSASNSGGLTLGAANGVSIAGSIVAGNSGPECTITSGSIAGDTYNLTSAGDTSCGFTAAEHDVAGDPQLGGLGNNGGPTSTQVPGPVSPALDQVPAGTSAGFSDATGGGAVTLCGSGAQDQRGTSRPQGAKCDIGAVEADQTTPTVDGPASVHGAVGVDIGTVTYTSTGSPQPTLSVDGSLPNGLTFTDNGDGTGKLTGTPAAGSGGEVSVHVKATNEAGSGSTSVDVTVDEAPTLAGPSASTYLVGQAGGPDVFEQISGHPVATLSTTSPLPSGVDFTPKPDGKGEIAGTPGGGTGGIYDVTIKGDNGTPPPATWPFTLTVNEASSLDGPDNATFTVGTAGDSGTFTGSGFPKPMLSATGLPAGLDLNGTGTAKITGTAHDSTGGEYDATVRASNGIGADATKQVHVLVREAPELDGPEAVRFVAGSNRVAVFSSDGYPTADLSVSGDLPDGISFHDNGNGSASLSGTASESAVGTYAVTVKASNGVAADSELHVSIQVVPPLGFDSAALPAASYQTQYLAAIGAIGGEPPYAFSLVSGSLPTGLTLNANGTITGTPTGSLVTSTFTVKVTDAADPAQSATKQFAITVGKGPTTTLVEPMYVVTKTGALGSKTHTWSARGQLLGGFPLQPLAGETLTFTSKSTFVCSGTTGSDGKVMCIKKSVAATINPLLNGEVTGTYAGSLKWKGSTATAGLFGANPTP